MTIGLILAGGTSIRFEQGDKALYQDFSERCFARLSALADEVFVSASASNLTELQKRLPRAQFLLDEAPYVSQGPLSALYALALKFSEKIDVLILPVDNPEISVPSLQLLLSAQNSYADDHYTIAHLNFSAQEIGTFLETGQRRMRAFLELLKAQPILLPENELIDHNKK
jgi:molybdopterin-guanine dinucleotide biosynthesis protein A